MRHFSGTFCRNGYIPILSLIDVKEGIEVQYNLLTPGTIEFSTRGKKVNFFPLPLDQLQKTKKEKKISAVGFTCTQCI